LEICEAALNRISFAPTSVYIMGIVLTLSPSSHLQLWDVKYLLEEDDDATEAIEQEEVAGSSRSSEDALVEDSVPPSDTMTVDSDEDTDTEKSGLHYQNTIIQHHLFQGCLS
jgi:hypothetical protein